ncbi:MAG: hypothetical protein U0804_08520 [Gemmataceae bacterium]
MRFRLALPAAAVAVVVAGSALAKLVVAFSPPAQRAVAAQVVVVGTVTSIDKEPVEVSPGRGAQGKVTYKLAVVKVDEALSGAAGLTHLKVGFVSVGAPAPQPGRPILPRRGGVELKEGDQYVFFLNRHHDGNFYVMPFSSPPLDPKSEGATTELAEVKKSLAVLADPTKALTAAKAEDRAFAATMLVAKYRAYPEGGGEPKEEPVAADESRLILKGLAEGDWKLGNRFNAPSPFTAFNQLGLTPQDGWVQPQVRPQPGQPVDFAAVTKEAFVKWLAGPGKDYRVKRLVAAK